MGILAVSACSAPSVTAGHDGGPLWDPILNCGDGGLTICTRRGEPVEWVEDFTGCHAVNVPIPTERWVYDDAGLLTCVEGFAFYCQMDPRRCP